jgi:menaquinone-dependent protoporphyrinogen oxidase
MNFVIIFATVEGHSAKVCQFVQTRLEQGGHTAKAFDTDATVAIPLEDADGVILIAPVHARRHPAGFEATLTALADRLREIPTLMLSVSLSAAFDEGAEDAQDYLDEMKMRTGLSPDREALIAGAVKLDRYDYFAEQVVKLVVMRGKPYDPSLGSHEFTDWDGLSDLVDAFVAETLAPAGTG